MDAATQGLTVYIKVQGVVRGIDHTREGETWDVAAARLYNRYITPAEAERFVLRLQSLPFGGLGSQDRYKVTMAWRPSPGGPAVPDPDIEVVTQPRRAGMSSSRPVHQHRRGRHNDR